jgi:hypothetical protein
VEVDLGVGAFMGNPFTNSMGAHVDWSFASENGDPVAIWIAHGAGPWTMTITVTDDDTGLVYQDVTEVRMI